MSCRSNSGLAPALCLLSLVLPFSCGKEAGGETKAESRRAVLVYGRGKDSITLDPAAASDGESTKVLDNVFETLVDFSEDPKEPSRILPLLATDWKEAPDRLSWVFHLRRGVRFHDGSRLDARAVKISLDRLIFGKPHPPAQAPYRGNFSEVAGIEVVDDFTVRIRLKRPSVVLIPNLAMFCASIVSPKALEERGKAFAVSPVGTGPFAFRSWKQDVKVVLERFDGWWGSPAPALDHIVFTQIKDWPSRMERLRSGEIQMTDDVVFQDIPLLRKSKGVEVQVRPGLNVCYLTLNNERPPFDKPLVRRAVAMAIDRSRILERGYYGYGEPARDLLPPGVPFYAGDVAPPFDPREARRLLEKAGVAAGTSVRLFVMNNPRPYLMEPDRVAEIIRDSLKTVGLEVSIRKYDWSSYLQKLQLGEHQMALIGWTTDNGDPDNFYGSLLSKALIGGTNYSRMADPPFEKLLQLSKGESDRGKREALFRGMQDILRERCPLVPLVYTPIASAYRSEVEGFLRHPIKIRLSRVHLRPD